MTLIVALVLSLVVLMLIRNQRVYRWQMEALRRVGMGAKRDIAADRPWEWRYEALRAVDYDSQMFRFWRRLDSFITPDLRKAMES